MWSYWGDRRALAALPGDGPGAVLSEGTSACYDQMLLKWLRNGQREDGPKDSSGLR